jgi:hypothetical protein
MLKLIIQIFRSMCTIMLACMDFDRFLLRKHNCESTFVQENIIFVLDYFFRDNRNKKDIILPYPNLFCLHFVLWQICVYICIKK